MPEDNPEVRRQIKHIENRLEEVYDLEVDILEGLDDPGEAGVSCMKVSCFFDEPIDEL